MDEVMRCVAEQACRDVVLAAADAVDARDYPALVMLFTEDVSLERPGGVVLRGRSEILQSYLSKDPHRLTQHVVCNHHVQLLSADLAKSRCKVLLYASDDRHPLTPQGRMADAKQQVGVIEDALVRTSEGWKIQNRKAWFELFIG